MTTNEAITIAAILLGPVLAVAVQIAAEKRKQLRDAQSTTFRMIVGTRHLPSDPAYSTSINMTPIDFNRVPKVMSAYNFYIESIRYRVAPENVVEHDRQIVSRQTKLIFEMANHLGYDFAETDIQTNPYAADGFVARDNLTIEGWRAWQRIAAALERQTEWMLGQSKDGAS